LARLFLRKYNLIIIDEATSALDYETEAKIVTAMKNKYSNASLIAIA
jgi:ABC-type bacteriocin/lantibiotic exporter with double-glycine peptidase domain